MQKEKPAFIMLWFYIFFTLMAQNSRSFVICASAGWCFPDKVQVKAVSPAPELTLIFFHFHFPLSTQISCFTSKINRKQQFGCQNKMEMNVRTSIEMWEETFESRQTNKKPIVEGVRMKASQSELKLLVFLNSVEWILLGWRGCSLVIVM